jgi:GDPmannose 4,6-dehydratase
MPKTALITGITGQDGSYLAEFLLSMGYQVHGLIRRSSSFATGRLDAILPKLTLHYGDVTDAASVRHVLDLAQPDEVYALAAQSHVRVSFDMPAFTAQTIAMASLAMLEAVREYDAGRGRCRLYQAGSSEMFGSTPPPQRENTVFHPRSPYGVAKVAAPQFGINYREAYGMFVANGILFNHESPRRGETFVTRKITRAVGRIKAGLQDRLMLGNLEARRDWGFAGDYVEAMWRMLQMVTPDDFVIATGESYSVKDFLELAFSLADMDWREFVSLDPRYYRPAEVAYLCGDPTKAINTLSWRPKTGFQQLVRMMVEHDMELARRERAYQEAV